MAPAAKSDKKKKDKSAENKENDTGQKLCCVPEEKVFCSKPEITDSNSLVKVDCSSGKCPKSGYMHSECFDKWEDLIVGFLAKQGRGRTWSEKQRYANVWANKGYDLVFKTCACDCGHGSLRKDLDFIPPKAVEGGAVAGAVQPQAEIQDKKKKKKEKTSLKPKLNFSVLNVSGSYFGSIKQKEDELDCEMKYKEPPPRVGHRLGSEKSDSPSPVPFIPGLNPPTASVSPQNKVKADPNKFEKANSAPPQNQADEGWVTVSKIGTNRRNSQQSLKVKGKNPLENYKAQILDTDSTNNNVDTQKPKNPEHITIPDFQPNPNFQPNSYNYEVHDPELLKKLRKKSQINFASCEPGDSSFPSLPMYQPPPSDKVFFEPAIRYERNDVDLKTVDIQNESLIKHDSNLPDHSNMNFPQYLGARPKSNVTPHKTYNRSSEEIYQSDEDISFEDLDKTIQKLCEASPCLTPKWSASPPKTPTTNPDKEMNMIWEQTKKFEMEFNSSKTENNSAPPDFGGSSDGKRDKNGFIHCSSCQTVHTSLTDFTNHCQSEKHRENAVWALKLDAADVKADLASGWENFGKVVDNWEDRVDAMSECSTHGSEKKDAIDQLSGASNLEKPSTAFEEVKRRALSRDVNKTAINEVKKHVTQKRSKAGSRPNTPDLTMEIDNLRKELEAEKEAKKRAQAEIEALRREIIAENEGRKRTLEELQILRSSKKSIEKQATIVENSLKLEESEKLKYQKLLDNSKALVKDKEEEITILKEEKEEYLKLGKCNTLNDDTNLVLNEEACDSKNVEIELNETKELLIQEQQKNDANSKLMKKMKEKSEKSLLREKDSRLLAEKTAELAEKQLAREEQKNKNLENQLKKSDAKIKDAEARVKEEGRKRIVAELELVDQQKKFNEISEKFVKQAAVLNDEKNDLAKAVNSLVKDKEILDEKVNKARAAATERLQDFVNEETCKKILQDSEEIVKQSFLKAIESNTDFDCYEDVKKIFGMVKDVVQSPESLNKDLLKSPVKFDVQKVKTEVQEYLKNRNKVTEDSFNIIFNSLEKEREIKEDGIVDIESDEEESSDKTEIMENDSILVGLKDIQSKEMSEMEEKDDDERNVVFELFDEVLRNRKLKETKENNDGWEMFEDELVFDNSLLQDFHVCKPVEKDSNVGVDENGGSMAKNVLDNLNEYFKGKPVKEDLKVGVDENGSSMTNKVMDKLNEYFKGEPVEEDLNVCVDENGSSMTNDVVDKLNEFFKDDVLKNCLTSIMTGPENMDMEEKSKSTDKEESKEIVNLENKVEEDNADMVICEHEEKDDGGSLNSVETKSFPGLDKYPQLGLDEEIDPYLGPDEPGEFDDFEADDDEVKEDENEGGSSSDKKDSKALDYDEYDLLGCPCKGEHNPNGSCKMSPLNPPTDPLRGPFDPVYFMEQEKHNQEPPISQMTGEELIAQWDRLMNLDLDQNFVPVSKPRASIPPLLNRLSSSSLPPLTTNNIAAKAAASVTRKYSSSISPAESSSNRTGTNSSATVDSSSPGSATPPQSSPPDLLPPSSFQPLPSIDSPDSSRLTTLEQSVSVLQSIVTSLGTQVNNLTTQLEDSNFQSGLLSRTVEMMQDRNCQLQRTVETVLDNNSHLQKFVEDVQDKNNVLEKKLIESVSRIDCDVPNGSGFSDDSSMKENLLDLLASCESFQKGFDTMAERQTDLENKLKTVTNNFDKTKAENKELRDQFAKLSDKFASLSLENQVDKSQTKAQLDSLGYNVAILTSKIPAESFSSTSGIRSEDTSENEEGLEKVDKNDGVSPLPPLDTLKDVVSKVVFSREESSSTEADPTSSSTKTTTILSSTTMTTATTTSSVAKMKKFVYSSSAVNPQSFAHQSPPVPGPVWMSPDGSMVAVPPGAGVPTTTSHASLPIPTAPRTLYGISPGRGSLGQMGTMTQTYMNQQGGMVYPPFNYPMQGLNMFYQTHHR